MLTKLVVGVVTPDLPYREGWKKVAQELVSNVTPNIVYKGRKSSEFSSAKDSRCCDKSLLIKGMKGRKALNLLTHGTNNKFMS